MIFVLHLHYCLYCILPLNNMAAVKFSHDYCVMLSLYFTAVVYNSQQGTIAIVLPRSTIFYYQIQIRSLPRVNSSHSCYILQRFCIVFACIQELRHHENAN